MVLASLSLLWMMFFGLSQFGMATDINGNDVRCPFSGHSMSICITNPTEHIQEWQSMFTLLPAQSDVLLALFALILLIAFTTLKYRSKFSLHNAPLVLSRLRSILRDSFQIFDPLKEAFSSGILNPKLY
jgi:hypothetical protein